MGTSTRLPGPRGQEWRTARERLTKATNHHYGAGAAESARQNTEGGMPTSSRDHPSWFPLDTDGLPDAEVSLLATQFLRCLAQSLDADPDAFGARATVASTGLRLLKVVGNIDTEGPPRGLEIRPQRSGIDEVLFARRFTEAVSGSGGRVIDHCCRRAAAHSAQILLRRHDVRRSLTGVAWRPGSLDDEFLCLLYRHYVADVLIALLTAFIEGNLTMVFPALPALDPVGLIAGEISGQLVDLVPTPCDRQSRHPDATSILATARTMIETAVDETLANVLEVAA